MASKSMMGRSMDVLRRRDENWICKVDVESLDRKDDFKGTLGDDNTRATD